MSETSGRSRDGSQPDHDALVAFAEGLDYRTDVHSPEASPGTSVSFASARPPPPRPQTVPFVPSRTDQRSDSTASAPYPLRYPDTQSPEQVSPGSGRAALLEQLAALAASFSTSASTTRTSSGPAGEAVAPDAISSGTEASRSDTRPGASSQSAGGASVASATAAATTSRSSSAQARADRSVHRRATLLKRELEEMEGLLEGLMVGQASAAQGHGTAAAAEFASGRVDEDDTSALPKYHVPWHFSDHSASVYSTVSPSPSSRCIASMHGRAERKQQAQPFAVQVGVKRTFHEAGVPGQSLSEGSSNLRRDVTLNSSGFESLQRVNDAATAAGAGHSMDQETQHLRTQAEKHVLQSLEESIMVAWEHLDRAKKACPVLATVANRVREESAAQSYAASHDASAQAAQASQRGPVVTAEAARAPQSTMQADPYSLPPSVQASLQGLGCSTSQGRASLVSTSAFSFPGSPAQFVDATSAATSHADDVGSVHVSRDRQMPQKVAEGQGDDVRDAYLRYSLEGPAEEPANENAEYLSESAAEAPSHIGGTAREPARSGSTRARVATGGAHKCLGRATKAPADRDQKRGATSPVKHRELGPLGSRSWTPDTSDFSMTKQMHANMMATHNVHDDQFTPYLTHAGGHESACNSPFHGHRARTASPTNRAAHNGARRCTSPPKKDHDHLTRWVSPGVRVGTHSHIGGEQLTARQARHRSPDRSLAGTTRTVGLVHDKADALGYLGAGVRPGSPTRPANLDMAQGYRQRGTHMVTGVTLREQESGVGPAWLPGGASSGTFNRFGAEQVVAGLSRKLLGRPLQVVSHATVLPSAAAGIGRSVTPGAGAAATQRRSQSAHPTLRETATAHTAATRLKVDARAQAAQGGRRPAWDSRGSTLRPTQVAIAHQTVSMPGQAATSNTTSQTRKPQAEQQEYATHGDDAGGYTVTAAPRNVRAASTYASPSDVEQAAPSDPHAGALATQVRPRSASAAATKRCDRAAWAAPQRHTRRIRNANAAGRGTGVLSQGAHQAHSFLDPSFVAQLDQVHEEARETLRGVQASTHATNTAARDLPRVATLSKRATRSESPAAQRPTAAKPGAAEKGAAAGLVEVPRRPQPIKDMAAAMKRVHEVLAYQPKQHATISASSPTAASKSSRAYEATSPVGTRRLLPDVGATGPSYSRTARTQRLGTVTNSTGHLQSQGRPEAKGSTRRPLEASAESFVQLARSTSGSRRSKGHDQGAQCADSVPELIVCDDPQTVPAKRYNGHERKQAGAAGSHASVHSSAADFYSSLTARTPSPEAQPAELQSSEALQVPAKPSVPPMAVTNHRDSESSRALLDLSAAAAKTARGSPARASERQSGPTAGQLAQHSTNRRSRSSHRRPQAGQEGAQNKRSVEWDSSRKTTPERAPSAEPASLALFSSRSGRVQERRNDAKMPFAVDLGTAYRAQDAQLGFELESAYRLIGDLSKSAQRLRNSVAQTLPEGSYQAAVLGKGLSGAEGVLSEWAQRQQHYAHRPERTPDNDADFDMSATATSRPGCHRAHAGNVPLNLTLAGVDTSTDAGAPRTQASYTAARGSVHWSEPSELAWSGETREARHCDRDSSTVRAPAGSLQLLKTPSLLDPAEPLTSQLHLKRVAVQQAGLRSTGGRGGGDLWFDVVKGRTSCNSDRLRDPEDASLEQRARMVEQSLSALRTVHKRAMRATSMAAQVLDHPR